MEEVYGSFVTLRYFKYEFAFHREWKAMPVWTIRKFVRNMFG